MYISHFFQRFDCIYLYFQFILLLYILTKHMEFRNAYINPEVIFIDLQGNGLKRTELVK